MKIAEIVSTLPPQPGGMGTVAFHTATQLAARDHAVTVFTLGAPNTADADAAAPFDIVRYRWCLRHGDGAFLPQLFHALRGFDAIHLHYPFFGGAEYVYLASRARKIPYLLTYHMDVEGNTFLKRMILSLYEPAWLRRILSAAAAVTSPGRAYLASTKAAPFLDELALVDVPHAGVDADRFSPGAPDPDLVSRHGLHGKTVALFVGNIQPFKGLDLLIDAVAEINDPALVLLVVGGGYAERDARAQAARRGIPERIIFAGPQSPDDLLPAYYRLADFLVLPSTYSESFGLVVLEAMASRIPAIVSDLPGPAQTVRDGVDGLLVRAGDPQDLVDKIRLVVADPKRRAALGRAALEKITTMFDWSHVGAAIESVLSDISARRVPR